MKKFKNFINEDYHFKVKHSSLQTHDRIFKLENRTIEFAEKPLYSDLFDTKFFAWFDVARLLETNKYELLTLKDWDYILSNYDIKETENGILIDNRLEISAEIMWKGKVEKRDDNHVILFLGDKTKWEGNAITGEIFFWESENRFVCAKALTSDNRYGFMIWPIITIN